MESMPSLCGKTTFKHWIADTGYFPEDYGKTVVPTILSMIDGQAHGPQLRTATCQLHMRKFADGDTIVIEPWRASAFPVIKDLMVDRGAFDRIVEVGGFITAPTGGQVRLGDVATVRVAPYPTKITHDATFRSIDITADVQGRDLGAVLDDVRSKVRSSIA